MNQSQLQALLDDQIRQDKIFNIVVHVHSNKQSLELAGAAGYADASGTIPMQPDTPYYLASITKMYTTAVIMRLHEQRRLDLDAPITQYIPDSLISGIHTYRNIDYSQQIKVHHLISQTSGIADYFEGKDKSGHSLLADLRFGKDHALTLETVLDIVRGMSPRFKPGTKAHYSDTNYQLLGAIIEATTEQSLADNYRQLIFEPLNLQQTYLYHHQETSTYPVPAAIYYDEHDLHLPLFLSFSGPDGGIVSNAIESRIFLEAFFAGKLFDQGFFQRMMKQWRYVFFPIQYGYGMMRIKLPRIFSPFQAAPELIGHSGSTGSFAFYNPEKDVYITGAVNQFALRQKPIQLMLRIMSTL